MNIRIPSYVNTALTLIADSGYEAYIVGGCVRDALLNKAPHDWDITTSAKPREIIEVFSGFRVIETGLKHGTVTVIIDGSPLEITTMRVDGEYSDNRHPDSVEFTGSITLDLSRRDFTVNAMAYNPETGICDPFGGMRDLENGVIKCVGEPEKRFTEDALRIVRGLRFSSVLGFEIEEKTSAEIINLKHLLAKVAAERKRTELLKLICGKDAKRILLAYPRVIFEIIPELEPMYKFPQNSPYHIYDVWEHTAVTLENVPPEPVYRMAMLLHDTGKPYAFFSGDDGFAHFTGHQRISYDISLKVLKDLRFSKAETEEISRIVLYHDIRPTGEREDTLLEASRIGADFMKKLYPVQLADAKGQNPAYLLNTTERIEKCRKILDSAVERDECLSIKQLAVNGKDIEKLGFCGQQIGEILKWLLTQVITGNVRNEKNEITEFIKNRRA